MGGRTNPDRNTLGSDDSIRAPWFPFKWRRRFRLPTTELRSPHDFRLITNDVTVWYVQENLGSAECVSELAISYKFVNSGFSDPFLNRGKCFSAFTISHLD